MNEIIENAVYNGVVRLNTITGIDPNPVGWYARNKQDPETGRWYGLEIGAFLSKEVFVGVSVHTSLRTMFAPTNINIGDGYKYYSIPRSATFAVSKFVNKKGIERPILVAPTDENPAVSINLISLSAKTAIVDCALSDNATVIKRAIDKDMQYIGLIAFVPQGEEMSATITDGIPGSRRAEVTVHKFNYNGVSAETDPAVDFDYPIKRRFMKFNMFIELPKKDDSNTNTKKDFSDNSKTEKSMNDKPAYTKPVYSEDEYDKPKPHHEKKWTNNKPPKNTGGKNYGYSKKKNPQYSKKRFD